ncbi:TraR/DksA family transcriptional regulator [Tepidicaulis sp.]|uniref:TraR/DksA family transcriptional regulator n=1 Tax=Tepidicaulis sp. TaxID=1920809 RepID=UPI003B5AB04A
MDDLTESELARYKALLLAQKDELDALSGASREAVKTVTLDQQSVGRLSRMDAMQAQAMAQETARRRQIQLQKIDAALSRMDEGEYGFCAVCGEPIARKRLDLDPAAATCIAHAK